MHKYDEGPQQFISLARAFDVHTPEFAASSLEDGVTPEQAEAILFCMICGFQDVDDEECWIEGAYNEPMFGDYDWSALPLVYSLDNMRTAQPLDIYAIYALKPDLTEIYIHPAQIDELKRRLNKMLEALNMPSADILKFERPKASQSDNDQSRAFS